MSLSSIGDGGFHNGRGGCFAIVGFGTGLILPYLERLLWARIVYYACGEFCYVCGCFITPADFLLSVQLLI